MSHFDFMMFSDQDDFSDFFAGDEIRNNWNDDRHGDRRPDNRWSTERDDQRDKNRFNRDKTGDRRPDNRYNQGNGYRDRRPDDNVDDKRYNNHFGGHGERERYRDRYHVNTDRVKDDREEYLDSASAAAMFFKRRQAMNHHGGKDNQETHLSYGK